MEYHVFHKYYTSLWSFKWIKVTATVTKNDHLKMTFDLTAYYMCFTLRNFEVDCFEIAVHFKSITTKQLHPPTHTHFFFNSLWEFFFRRENFVLVWQFLFCTEKFAVRIFRLTWELFFPVENFSPKNSSTQSENVW